MNTESRHPELRVGSVVDLFMVGGHKFRDVMITGNDTVDGFAVLSFEDDSFENETMFIRTDQIVAIVFHV